MLNIVFPVGMLIFTLSSLYFLFKGKNRNGFNSAFLVSIITLTSYVLMWQGGRIVTTADGQPIYWTRWLFYTFSCTLLMFEIASLKQIRGGKLYQLFYLTAIVMLTGVLSALDLSDQRYIYFGISSIAYVLLIAGLRPLNTKESRWVLPYITFGWTVFPLVFLLAPTGFGLIGAGIANLVYLLLDIFTKIIFNVQLESAETSS